MNTKYKGKRGYTLEGKPGERRWTRVPASQASYDPSIIKRHATGEGLRRTPTIIQPLDPAHLEAHFNSRLGYMVNPGESLAEAISYEMSEKMQDLNGPKHDKIEAHLHDHMNIPRELLPHAMDHVRTGELNGTLDDYITTRSQTSADAMRDAHAKMFALLEHAGQQRGLPPGYMARNLLGYRFDGENTPNGTYYTNTREVGISVPTLMGAESVPLPMRGRVDPVESVVMHELAHYYSHVLTALDAEGPQADLTDHDTSGNARYLHLPVLDLTNKVQRDLDEAGGFAGVTDHPLLDTATGARLGYIWTTMQKTLNPKPASTRIGSRIIKPKSFDNSGFEAPTVLSELAMYHPESLHALDAVYNTNLREAVHNLWGANIEGPVDPKAVADATNELLTARVQARTGQRRTQSSIDLDRAAQRVPHGIKDPRMR